ncbi:tRNA pseudouridine(55) synthase TruB [Sphingoaurantiacus capsulatus]|uniref:tRNA pseudouridine synthase B n=1 Tax=Sphingoaurantiacus capsulatus TaxID=1771310 RepID=A0ABV7X9A8_9SPHN
MHGWIILDKPLGLSSAQAVAAVKRNARESGWGKVKIGHGGTLDPLATGVLPIALGEATKLTGRLLDATKRYRFTIAFGTATATDDAEGEVVATSDVRPDRAAVEAALPRFTGPITQTPPAYSALKVDGQRAYALARAGETVELASRDVTVYALALEACDGASATLDATVSKGTYIRSLARDLALALGSVGHVSMLRRTKAGPFGEDSAISLDKLNALGHSRALEQALLPLTAGLDDIPVLTVDPAQAAMLRQGRLLDGRPDNHGLHLATAGSVPVALVDVSADGVRVVRGFNI